MIILIGPSASGKTEVAKELMNKYHYKKVITYTTRLPRENETNDVDYHFISLDDFVKKISQDFFFETVNYNGNFYGTARADLNDNSVVVLEPRGFRSYKEKGAKNVVSFYLESDEEHRIKRMKYRGDRDDKIKERIANDRKAFSSDEIQGIDFILDSNDLTIIELAKEIDELYLKKMDGN